MHQLMKINHSVSVSICIKRWLFLSVSPRNSGRNNDLRVRSAGHRVVFTSTSPSLQLALAYSTLSIHDLPNISHAQIKYNNAFFITSHLNTHTAYAYKSPCATPDPRDETAGYSIIPRAHLSATTEHVTTISQCRQSHTLTVEKTALLYY